jgi:hypothetical protein
VIKEGKLTVQFIVIQNIKVKLKIALRIVEDAIEYIRQMNLVIFVHMNVMLLTG